MKNEHITTPERMMTHTAAFQEGIVPMEVTRMDVRRALKDLPPEDARKMKRKFRKLWRKLARQSGQRTMNDVELNKPAAEVPSKQGMKPTKRAKLRRKELVQTYLFTEHVAPMLEKFKKIERK
jgi:hypothetical protein